MRGYDPPRSTALERFLGRTFLGLVAVCLAALAFGQAQTTGTLIGTVKDAQGNPIPGARVELISTALQGERIVAADDTGRFLVALLPVGPYSVTVVAPGKKPQEISFRLGVGQTVPLDLTLEEGTDVTEEVTVTAEAGRLETTAKGENFDYQEEIENLPIQQRTIEDVALYAPNVVEGASNRTVSISGAPSFDTVTLLDGAEISDPYFGAGTTLYFEDAIEEVQVLVNGISARYGRFQGGVLNAVTRTGGNEFDGTVRAEFTNQSWNSKTPFGEEQADDTAEKYQATLGGFLVKDRLWFFAGARTVPESTTNQSPANPLVEGQIPYTQQEDRWQLKLRGAVTPNHTIEASRFEYDSEVSNFDPFGPGAAGDLRAVDQRIDPRTVDTLSYKGVLSPTLFLDGQATRKRVSIEAGGVPEFGSPIWDFDQNLFYGNGWFDFNDPDIRDNNTASLALTQALSTTNWGSHTIEYGIQYVDSQTGGQNRQSPTGFNYINVSPDFVEPVLGPDGQLRFNVYSGGAFRFAAQPFPGDPSASLKSTAVYIQDSWQINPDWRVDAGIRWEDYQGDGPRAIQTADFTDWAPRLGVTYSINGNWQLQATAGKYVARLNDGIANGATGVGAAPRSFDLYVGPDLFGATYDDINAIVADHSQWITLEFESPEFPTVVLDQDLKSPYAWDRNLSVQRMLPQGRGVVTLTYSNRDYEDLLDDYVGGYGFSDIPGGDQVDTTLWANSPEARRTYEALALVWDYRPTAVWSVGGNYTYSRLRGNYEGEAGNQPASGDQIGDYVNARPEDKAAPYGKLAGDVPHRLRAWSTYRWDLDRAGALTLGGILNYQSGFNYSLVSSVPFEDVPEYLGDAGNEYNYYFNGRGNERFNDFWSLDASVRYQFPIYRKVDGWVKANVVNVLDNDELISFNTSGNEEVGEDGQLVFVPEPIDPITGQGFGVARSEADYQTPRTYLVTLGLSW